MNLSAILDFIESKQGIESLVVIFVVLLAGLAVIRLLFSLYRKLKSSIAPEIVIKNTKLLVPRPGSNFGELLFELKNTRPGKAKITSLEVVNISCGQSTKTMDAVPLIKPSAFEYAVDLRSDRKSFAIRASQPPNKAPRPILGRGQLKTFRVKLKSEECFWYRIYIAVQWHDKNQTNNKNVQNLQSKEMYIEFQPS